MSKLTLSQLIRAFSSADKEELRRFLETATQPKVREFIKAALEAAEQNPSPQIAEKSSPISISPPPSAPARPTNDTGYVAIDKFGWEQSGRTVKIYVDLPNVGSLSKDSVSVDFQKESFDLKVHGLDGKNYRFAIWKLCGPLDREKCLYKIRTNSVSITLTKSNDDYWQQLHYKENKMTKRSKDVDKEDPTASLMGLMKDMYEEGDEEMKRTIAKAWTEGQQKKGLNAPDNVDSF